MRDQLQALVRAGHTQQTMADILCCSQSAVSREVQRNGSAKEHWYLATTAQRRAVARRQHASDSRPRWHDDLALRAHVEAQLHGGRSPDQIAGRMRRDGWETTVSHQSIYDYVEAEQAAGGDLHTFLRYQGKKHKFRGFANSTARILDRRGIEERPAIVDAKGRSGDWESDLVVSGWDGAGAVATFVERTCMYFRAILVADKSAGEMVRAAHAALDEVPSELRLTMTHDNGKEIMQHVQITAELGITVYCARPYHSWERGLNEFMNRELRRFFPKGTDFSAMTQTEVDAAVSWLNNCPRRSLNYRTPQEAFEEKLLLYAFRA